MENIDIGKKYIINGNDYNITITPINHLDSFKCRFFFMWRNFEKSIKDSIWWNINYFTNRNK